MDDLVLLSSPYLVQSDASPDAFAHFMEVLDGPEPQLSPQITNNLMSLEREFGHNGLITSFALQHGVPSHQENVLDVLQELNKAIRCATFEAGLRSIRGSLTKMQGDVSVIRAALDVNLKRI
jgi:hypothetical protein